jgi:hypothetical protein
VYSRERQRLEGNRLSFESRSTSLSEDSRGLSGCGNA